MDDSATPISAAEAVGLLQTDVAPRKRNTTQAPADVEPGKDASTEPVDPGAALEDEPVDTGDEELPPDDGDDAAPPDDEETSGEDDETGDPEGEDLPPIDPPSSWTKAEKEAFAALPREHQETISDRERARAADIRRTQNEAADIRKAADAAREAAEKARQEYEAALPDLLNTIQAQQMREFPDVRSWDDVERLQRDDPIRYQAWDLARQRAAAVEHQITQAKAEKERQDAENFTKFVHDETVKFLDAAPEFRDPATAPQLQTEVRAMLGDFGVTDSELAALWNGDERMSIRDHRVQLIIRDALRYRKARQATKTPPRKPVPPVQKPGTARSKNEVASERVKSLDAKLTRSGDIDDAMALLRATGRV